MRVKRLEIQGFKSFKDKTVIHFDEGITGIVGPNGCGKSNIVDAFFWVMGEQSYKHMRGTGSEDLIFNGSSKYHPLGVAEATLVLETDAIDADGEPGSHLPSGAGVAGLHLRSKEIAVTRRVYRTGEGEYFLNGVPARLKDIQELFMDTGVGAKGYSVIEQGQIGKIVNSKPEERRLLIEEAAGIAKYKARKKESLRKMEATQGNLARLADILQEIERNLGSLDRQAQKARLYRKYKDELLEQETSWGRRRHSLLTRQLAALKTEREGLEADLAGLRAELQTAENAIETDRIAQTTDAKEAEELQARAQALSDELTRQQSARELARRRLSDLDAQRGALREERATLDASIREENERLETREAEEQDSDRVYAEAAANARALETEGLETRRGRDDARARLDRARRAQMAALERSHGLQARCASLQSRAESAAAEAERFAQELAESDARLTQLRADRERAESEAKRARDARDAERAERAERQSGVGAAEAEFKLAERARVDREREAQKLRSRQQSLEELIAAREGFSDGAKAAWEWAQGTGTHLSALADALAVEPGFELALQATLEGWLEVLVADPDQLERLGTLAPARAQLAAGNAARVSFLLPAEAPSVPSPDLRVEELEAHGIRGVAPLSDRVRTTARIPAGVERLLECTWVVESLPDRIPPEWVSREGWGLVTPAGEWLGPANGAGIVLRCGRPGETATGTQLRHQRSLAETTVALQLAEAQVAEAEAGAQRGSARHEAERAQLHETQTRLQNLEVEAASLERDSVQATRALKEEEIRAARVGVSRERADAERLAAEEARAAAERELAEIAEGREDEGSQLEELAAELEARELDLGGREARLAAARVEEARVRERASGLRRELEATRGLVADRTRRLAEIDRGLARAEAEEAEHARASGDAGFDDAVERLTLDVAEARRGLSAAKDRLERANQALASGMDRVRSLHRTGEERNLQGTQLALEAEKLGGELAHLVQNLEEKYGPGCLERVSAAGDQQQMEDPVLTAEISAEEEKLLAEEVERLRERLRRLGEVNPEAVEQFEEMKKRHEYLLGEKNDLERSLENLQEAIEHINQTSEERFRRAFEAIADRFQRLFPIIFGGGMARLSLIYPEGSTDILDAGVDILAQPPGKKIVNIGLLSGGEKALTAVSLIFAIFMVKPSPFCVLDEVDAPLDDANIGKFNALLREMSQKSQFILITHNKKTMELNDKLYGVTMEEPGVSKMVSIQLQ